MPLTTISERMKRDEAILEMFNEGAHPRVIAEKFKLSRQLIYVILTIQGVEFNPKRKRYYK